MAQKRMIDKKISISEDVANLTTEAQLLFKEYPIYDNLTVTIKALHNFLLHNNIEANFEIDDSKLRKK